MLESDDYLQRERQRLADQAETLAKDKERILPKPRYAEPPQIPAPTMRNFRKWQWSILGLLLLFNVSSVLGRLRAPPDSVMIVVSEPQVKKFLDEETGEASYLVKIDSDDLRPYFRVGPEPPLALWMGGNALLIAALAYTRYRIWSEGSATNGRQETSPEPPIV